MTMFANEIVATVEEMYWADDNAAGPVLLIDEATEAITAAVHQVRRGSVLDDRDLAAASTALGDLLGGLGQLADLLTSSVAQQQLGIDPRHVDRLTDQWESVRAMTVSALRPGTDQGRIPSQRT